MLLGFVTIFLVFGLLQQPIKNSFNIDIAPFQMFIFAGLIIFSSFLVRIFQKPIAFKIIIFLLFLILIYGFSSSPLATWQIVQRTIKMMLMFMIVLGIFKALIDFHISKTGIKEIKINELESRMNLDEMIVKKIKSNKKFYNKYIGRFYPGGLIPEQVEHVREWLKKDKKIGNTIKIYKSFPFVIWIFFGVIITLILKSSLMHLFINLG